MIDASLFTVAFVMAGLAILIPSHYVGRDIFQNLGNWIENPVATEILRIGNELQEVISNEFRKLDTLMQTFEERVRSTVEEGRTEGNTFGPGKKPRESIFPPLQLLFFTVVFIYGLLFSRKTAKLRERKTVEEKNKSKKKKKTKKGRRGKKVKKMKRKH